MILTIVLGVALIVALIVLALVSQKNTLRGEIIQKLEEDYENIKNRLSVELLCQTDTTTEYMNERKDIVNRYDAMVYYLAHTILKNEKARQALDAQDEAEFVRLWSVAYDHIKELSDSQLEQELRAASNDEAGYSYYGIQIPKNLNSGVYELTDANPEEVSDDSQGQPEGQSETLPF